MNWNAANGKVNTGGTLSIGSGGILVNNAAGTGFYENKRNLNNLAFIGPTNGVTSFSDPGEITAQGYLTTAAPDLVVWTGNNANLRIASVISGSCGLTKSGPGTLDLSNGNSQAYRTVNTFTGKVVINEGILLINSDLNLGASPTSYVPDAVTMNGGELWTYATTGFGNANRGITVGTRGGIAAYSGGATTSVNQIVTGIGGMTFWSNGYGDGSGAGDQIMQVSGANTYQGATNLWITPSWNTGQSGGPPVLPMNPLSIGSLNLTGNNTIPAASAVTANMVDWNGNTLPNPYANQSYKSIGVSAYTQAFGSLSGDLGLAWGGAGTLTLGATNNLSATYSGVISGPVSIVKNGNGTQTLSGSNTYTGSTTINAGALNITGQIASPVTVNSGGALGGSGVVSGAVSVAAGGILAPATTPTGFSQLTIANSLTVAGSSNFNYNLTGGGSDEVLVSGSGQSITLNGASQFLNLSLFNYTPTLPANIVLLQATGGATLADNVPDAGWTVSGPATFKYTILNPADAGGVPGEIILQLTSGKPAVKWTGEMSRVGHRDGELVAVDQQRRLPERKRRDFRRLQHQRLHGHQRRLLGGRSQLGRRQPAPR